MPTFALVDLDETERLAAALAPHLRDGDVLELLGDMGAGKTTFTGALARALGSREPARSPTYTVAHRYELPQGRWLAHLDCYRAAGTLDAAAWGDLEPYFDGGIACIEWPEAIRPWLTDRPAWQLQLDPAGIDGRVARVTAPVDRATAALLPELLRAWRPAAPVAPGTAPA
ncbi:MAG: tRNA ((37)-N6)-threonylcarbamoyltransferase complex ATPase subunit type 1 TsaE [Thermoleophilia bacterium]|nr:tRNA ((37)-N6)-threonylcarbamoyltransferase complex ATPase subunit type 1 TsaE [Thermoleophilia bacterium]